MDAQVVTNATIHQDLLARALVVGQNDGDLQRGRGDFVSAKSANRLLPQLASQDDRVSAEQLQLVQLRLRQTDDRVVVVAWLVDDETIRLRLPLENRRGQVVVALGLRLLALGTAIAGSSHSRKTTHLAAIVLGVKAIGTQSERIAFNDD